MDKTHRCRYCKKDFAKTDKGIETRTTKFGEQLYHYCPKSPFPNKFVALESAKQSKLSQFFGCN